MLMAVASVKSMMLYHSNVNCISTSTSIGQVMLSALDEKRKRHMVMMSALDEKRKRHMLMVSALVDEKRKRHMVMMSGQVDEKRKRQMVMMSALDDKSKKGGGVPNSNYVVPLDKAASCITRPLAEILRDLNKRIPDNILKPNSKQLIPWYHANRMLSFYAPGWCGEVRDVIFADDGSVTVVYRVTIRGSDGEAYRESTGTILSSDPHSVDQVGAAEEIAFVRACARFGLGLYLYHEE